MHISCSLNVVLLSKYLHKKFNIQVQRQNPTLSGHEVRPINDQLQPHDFIRPVVSLKIVQVVFR
jgi:hypothetical protein